MRPVPPLQPTLWRTCRVLANRTRLRMIRLLLDGPRTVSAVAEALHQPLSLTSEYLRALEARGLLAARRVGRRVEYGAASELGSTVNAGLAAALRGTFKGTANPINRVFRLATAFTHPRRVQILRVLRAGPRTLGELRTHTRISRRALLRHVAKLKARGFLAERQGRYAAASRRDPLGRELARLAEPHMP